jgi:hypothetical protein
MGREVIEDDPEQVRLRIMDIDELAHAVGEVAGRAMVGDLDLAPGAVCVEEDEEIDRAVAPILAVVAFQLARRGRDRLARLADQLGRAFVEAHHRPPRIGGFGIEVEDILHAGDVAAVNLRNAPHVLAPRLEVVLGQAPAHGLA